MAEYRIVELKDGTYGVAVLRPPKVTETVYDGFATSELAQMWIDQQKRGGTFDLPASDRWERNLPRNARDKD